MSIRLRKTPDEYSYTGRTFELTAEDTNFLYGRTIQPSFKKAREYFDNRFTGRYTLRDVTRGLEATVVLK